MSEQPVENFCLRFRPTDWDREAVKALNDYLATVEPDPIGNRPAAFLDEPIRGLLGIFVYPLDRYSETERDTIVSQCAAIRESAMLARRP
jgi:hypothetical protein